MECSPWVEKYRPVNFENVVLNKNNRKIIENIIKRKYFPHLILYGPPGTGKTTTAINLIEEYQRCSGEKHPDQVIHLNASDERGIEVIRNCIQQFVTSKGLFKGGLKFIILDEVDYMTKNAQYALRFLIQNAGPNIRFCLICNYISRIHYSLQNEFVKLCFNYLPREQIIRFLSNICEKEHISYSENQLASLHKIYKSDIRSMINHLQSNHNASSMLMDVTVMENILNKIRNIKQDSTRRQINLICEEIERTSQQYNIGGIDSIKKLLNYIISYKISKSEDVSGLMKLVKFIVHNPNANSHYIINYCIISLSSLCV